MLLGLLFLCGLVWMMLCAAAGGQTRLVLNPGSGISTLAGSGRDAPTVAGVATDAALGSPRGLAYDSSDNLYVADARNHQVYRVSVAGALTVFAGNGTQGFAGDGGPALAATLNAPTALAFAADGALMVADTGNHRVRRIANGSITTVVGNGTPGFGGDGGAGTAAQLRSPAGLAFGSDGSLYIADTGNHRIRKLRPDGTLTTVAGNGSEGDAGDGGPAVAATFRAPGALQMLSDGRLLIADRSARRIRALLPDGTVTAYATAAALRQPEGLGTDVAGNLLITDAGNQQVTLSGADATGNIAAATLAGTGAQGKIAAGTATSSPLDSPAAAAARSSGDVAISDRRNHQVQRVALPSLAFGDVPAGRTSTAQTLTLTNGGSIALTVDAVQIPAGFSSVSAGATCAMPPFALQPDASCDVPIAFAPVGQGQQAAFARVQLAGAPPASVALTGNGTVAGTQAASLTALSSNGSISYAGAPVLLSAAVAGSLLTAPTGNIGFYDGAALLATAPLTSGAASLLTSAMQTGQHALHAGYSGDAVYAPSVSPSITQTVVAAPDFSLASGASSYSGKAGGSMALPLSVVPFNGTLNHTVQMTVSGLPAGATAVFTPATFTLAGDPVSVNLAITMPVTLAGRGSTGAPPAIALGLFTMLLASSHRLTRMARTGALLGLLLSAVLCCGGCGGGFRATSTAPGSTSKTFNYTAVVTATTTGVLGDALTHTATVGLVVTQ